MTKSPRVVWMVAVYFLVRSITVGGGVVRCSIQVTISLSQPGAYEAVGELPPKSHPTTASNTNAEARASFTRETLPGSSALLLKLVSRAWVVNTPSACGLSRADCDQHRQHQGQSRDDQQRGRHPRRRPYGAPHQRADA